MAGLDARGEGITSPPLQAALAITALEKIEGGASVAAAFLGLGMGIPETLEALGGRGRTTLLAAG